MKFTTNPRRLLGHGLTRWLPAALLLLLPHSGGAGLGPGPGTYRLLSEEGVARIPFDVYRDDIRMIAEVNGREARMLIDNGVLWDELLFFGSPRVDSLGLNCEDEIFVGGAGEGDPVPSGYTTGVGIRFPGVEFRDQAAVVMPYTPGEPNPWEGAEGQVSATFLKHFVVSIDFDESMMTLTEPDRFQYRGGGAEVPLIPLGPGSFAIPALIDLPDGRRLDVDLALDLGGVNPLDLEIGGPHDIRLPEGAREAILGYGAQGLIRGHFARVPAIEIGGYRVEDVLTGFQAVDPGDCLGDHDEFMIGFPLFARFNIVFDYPGGRMYIEPNRSFGEPFADRK